jgi:hypothetical protein
LAHKLIVAYKTKLVPALQPDLSKLDPPATHKSDEAIAKWRATQAEKAAEICLAQPYTATFERIKLYDNQTKQIANFVGREKENPCVQLRNYLLRIYPNAWANSSLGRQGPPQAILVGFNPGLLIKIVGLELTFPSNQPAANKTVAMPLGFWVANSDHRDIEELVHPDKFCKMVPWSLVLKAFELDSKFATWDGPGRDVDADLDIAITLAGRLRLLDPEPGDVATVTTKK